MLYPQVPRQPRPKILVIGNPEYLELYLELVGALAHNFQIDNLHKVYKIQNAMLIGKSSRAIHRDGIRVTQNTVVLVDDAINCRRTKCLSAKAIVESIYDKVRCCVGIYSSPEGRKILEQAHPSIICVNKADIRAAKPELQPILVSLLLLQN